MISVVSDHQMWIFVFVFWTISTYPLWFWETVNCIFHCFLTHQLSVKSIKCPEMGIKTIINWQLLPNISLKLALIAQRVTETETLSYRHISVSNFHCEHILINVILINAYFALPGESVGNSVGAIMASLSLN